MKKRLLLIFGFLFCMMGSVAAQSKAVKGKVTATDDGSAMPGVVVQVKGTSVATQTDGNGDYSINASSDQTLVFSFVGFNTIEEAVGSRSVINVALETDQKLLDEVIVTGVAGATSRKKLTVSVAKVGSDKLSIVPATSAAGALVGKVAGLQTSQRGGSPGAGTDMLLRGDNNINGSSAPLLLVDGIILTGSLADLNVDDIESIEVVKGAAAAALYGSRAGNGVIAVTTKRGANLNLNKTDVVVRNEIGAQQLAKYLETADSHLYSLASDWQSAQGKYTKYAGVTYPADYRGTGFDPRIVGSRSLDPDGYMDNPYGVYRDMQRDFFRTGTQLTNFISVANRSEKTNIYISFENNIQQGVVKLTDGYKRQNFRINLDQQIAKWLRFSATNAFINRTTSTPTQSDGLFYNIARLEKDVDLMAAKNPDGQDYYLRYNHFNEETTNPLYELSKRKVHNNSRRWMANYGFNARLTSWADIDLTHTIENGNISSGTIYPQNFWTRGGGVIENNYMSYNNGSISKTKSETKTNNTQFTLNLSQKFGDLSTRAKLSYLYENRHEEGNYTFGSQFVVSGIENFNNIKPENLTGASSYIQDERAQNYFAILGLDWKDKYLFDGMFRYDGSSLFGPESRWNPYYRISGAYRISEDVSINGIDELKIRAAHGTAGIRPGFNWQYEVYSLGSGNASASQAGNRFLKPSQTEETEVGLNVEFLKKFQFEATYAMSTTSDQFLNVPLVAFLNDGFSRQWQNAGTVKSNTLEFTLGANWYKKKDLSWNTNVVFSKVRQRITELPIAPFLAADQQINGDQDMYYIKEGELYGSIYGYRMLKSMEEMAQQLPADKTINDYEINSDGYVVPKGSQGTAREMPVKKLNADGTPWHGVIGNGTPDFLMGISNTVMWKNIQFYLLLDWKQGGDVYNGKEQRLAFNNVSKRQDMTGVPDNLKKVAGYIGANTGFYDSNNGNAYWVEDGTYLKVREVALGYSLPSQWVKGFAKGITARVVGRNLLTFTKYTGYDPEVGSLRFPTDGIYANPLYRNYAFSLTLNF